MRTASPPAVAPALDVDGVSYAYGARLALDQVSFTVAPSSFTVLLGLNGAGKSTLFSLVTRLYAAPSGRIRIFGHDVAREPGAALRRLGVVFQSRAIDLDLSVKQNLVYHAALHGIAAGRAAALIEQGLQQAGLADRAQDKVGALSGGQMRRIEIARALLHRPKLIVLDEATAGLDVNARADILARVRQLLKDEGVGVLWATHLIDEVDPGDDVVVLHKGRVLAQGPVADILKATRESAMAGAFAALTRADAPERAGASR